MTQPSERTSVPAAQFSAAGQAPTSRATRPENGTNPDFTDAQRVDNRGFPGWVSLGILLAIAGVGGLIDQVGGASIKGGFAIGLILASFVGIVVVRRSDMFTIVIAPPLVYFIASAGLLYFRSGGLSNRKVLIDYASQWLVYGFPAIAGATAVVLLVAGVRLIVRR